MRESIELISRDLRRSEADPAAIRLAHYTSYPRVSLDQRECTAIAREETSSEISLVAKESEQIGALLRLEVNDLQGAAGRETLARVVSCSARDDGRFDVRVEPIAPKRARFVRRAPDAIRRSG